MYQPNNDDLAAIEHSRAPLIEHLTELRRRLIRALGAVGVLFVVCFFFADEIYNILVWPLQRASGDEREVQLIYTALQGYFIAQLKLAFFGAIFLGFPVIAVQLYRFVVPGLYQREKQAFLPYLIATPVLFVLGAMLVYFVIMPLAAAFFLSMEQPGGDGQAAILSLPTVNNYLSLIMTLILAFGICFQLPVVLTLLARVGIIGVEQLVRWRKYAVVGLFAIAALMTPPDFISQIMLALPTLLLYELSIFLVRRVERARAPDQDPEPDTEPDNGTTPDDQTTAPT